MARLKWWDKTGLTWVYVPVGTSVPEIATWHGAGAATVLTGKAGYSVRAGGFLGKVTLSADTAPTGAAITVDVLVNGVVERTATLAATVATQTTDVPSPSVALSIGDIVTVDVTQIGSSEPGQDLTVQVELVETDPAAEVIPE